MTSTAEQIAVVQEMAILKQLQQHHGGGATGLVAAFRQRAQIFHPDACGEPAKFRALVAARDALMEQMSAVEKALLGNEDTP